MLALAVAILLQDAEATFRKIEEKALQMPYFSATVVSERGGTQTLLLGRGNRLRYTGLKKPLPTPMIVASNGGLIRLTSKEATYELDTPESLRGDLTRSWVRLGGAGVNFYFGALFCRNDKTKPLHVPSMFRVSEFEHGPEENGEKSLTYTFTYVLLEGAGERTCHVKLTYDPGTLTIRKRTWRGVFLGENVERTETTREFASFEDVPADRFKLQENEDDSEEAPMEFRNVGSAASDVVRREIRPLMEREKIPYLPRQKSSGVTEFMSNTPANARRARALIRRDAAEKGYQFLSWRETPFEE